MPDRNFRVPSGLGGIKRVIIREPNPPPEMIYPEEEQAEEQIGAVRPVIPNAPPPPIIEVPTVVAPPQVKDDYAAIRPEMFADRSTTKDFLESGSAGTYVNVSLDTPIVPWAAGVGPGAPFNHGAQGQYQQVINVRTEDRKSVPLTLCFDCQHFERFLLTSGLCWYDMTAKIQWGVEGASVEAEIDIRDGMSVSLCASSLRVSIGINTWFGVVPAPAGTSVRMGAFVSKGAFGKIAPQRTIIGYNDSLGLVNDVFFPIPSFARKYKVSDNPWLANTRTTRVGAGGILAIDNFITGANQSCEERKVPNGSMYVLQRDTLGVTPFTYGWCVFELGF